MVTPKQVGKSVIFAVVLLLILQELWPYLPKKGFLSPITWQLQAVSAVVIGLIVVGPGRVAWDILMDNDGW